MKISVAQIRSKNPCYDPTEIKGITEDTQMTLLEWMKYKAEKLTNANKVWLFSRFGTELQCHTFAIWCARSCKTKVKEIADYIDAIENYYIKKTITAEQLSVAYRAADRAADRAVYCVAYTAAYRAADWAADTAADTAAYRAADWAADGAVYLAAYWAADGAADRAAYRAADCAAERAKQVKQIIKILKEASK